MAFLGGETHSCIKFKAATLNIILPNTLNSFKTQLALELNCTPISNISFTYFVSPCPQQEKWESLKIAICLTQDTYIAEKTQLFHVYYTPSVGWVKTELYSIMKRNKRQNYILVF